MGSNHSRWDRPVCRHPIRGPVARGRGKPNQCARRIRDRTRCDCIRAHLKRRPNCHGERVGAVHRDLPVPKSIGCPSSSCAFHDVFRIGVDVELLRKLSQSNRSRTCRERRLRLEVGVPARSSGAWSHPDRWAQRARCQAESPPTARSDFRDQSPPTLLARADEVIE